MSPDMSPYCSAHDEWLIMKLCTYVGYHDAKNVSNFGGGLVTQLNLVLYNTIKWPYQPKHSPSPNRLSATSLIVQCQYLIHVSMLFVLWSQAMSH